MKYKTEQNDDTKRRSKSSLTKGAFGNSNNVGTKINCFICGTGHKFSVKKFPIAVKERTRDKQRKVTGEIIKGYLDRKCSRKEAKHMNLQRDQKLIAPVAVQ